MTKLTIYLFYMWRGVIEIMNNFEFEEVYTKNSHLIYHIAYSYLKNSEDAKDIHQEVFFKYLSKH